MLPCFVWLSVTKTRERSGDRGTAVSPLRGDRHGCGLQIHVTRDRARFDRDGSGSLVACTISCARPLKRLRRGSLSDSWQFGSPLPTPISEPSPEILKPSVVVAVGTCLPWWSRVSTRITATSSPSASISVRSAVSLRDSGGPVVSRFSVNTTFPLLLPRASRTPGSYFTFHSRCVSG